MDSPIAHNEPLNYEYYDYKGSNYLYENNIELMIYFIGFLLLFISICIGLYNCYMIQKIVNKNNINLQPHKIDNNF